MTPKKLKLHLTKENCNHLKNLYLDTDIGQLDCIGFVEGVGNFEHVKQQSEIIEINKIKIPVLNIDAIIESKKTLNRDKDKETILQLKALRRIKKP
ncbi:MAG: hypothetical protein BWY69_01020 [Planctomycetes bacterium ADurb.Bin401]|nr:MAG: hypothetical protein BWY69_01020 [Planctomycetes bacterium ADurb.Bin401]